MAKIFFGPFPHLFLIFTGILSASSAEGPTQFSSLPTTVKLSTGVHGIALGHKYAAEMTETLRFTKPLPEIPVALMMKQGALLTKSLEAQFKDTREPIKFWNETITSVLKFIKLERKNDIEGVRARRGIQALGSIFSGCCDVLTGSKINPLQTDVRNLGQSMRHLASAQSTLERNLINTIGQVKKFFVSTVQNSFKRLESEFQFKTSEWTASQIDNEKKFRLILHMHALSMTLLEILTEEVFLQGIVSQCAKGHLSPQILSLDELDQHISLF